MSWEASATAQDIITTERSTVRGVEAESVECSSGFRLFVRYPMTEAKVVKVDSDRRLVFGWANVSINKAGVQLTDSHFEQIDPEDLENAAYNFVLSFRDMNADHTEPVLGQLVESMMFTPEKCVALGLDCGAVDTGWWVGFYVEDDTAWEKVKKNEYAMFSIEGTAIPMEA